MLKGYYGWTETCIKCSLQAKSALVFCWKSSSKNSKFGFEVNYYGVVYTVIATCLCEICTDNITLNKLWLLYQKEEYNCAFFIYIFSLYTAIKTKTEQKWVKNSKPGSTPGCVLKCTVCSLESIRSALAYQASPKYSLFAILQHFEDQSWARQLNGAGVKPRPMDRCLWEQVAGVVPWICMAMTDTADLTDFKEQEHDC